MKVTEKQKKQLKELYANNKPDPHHSDKEKYWTRRIEFRVGMAETLKVLGIPMGVVD